MRNKVAKALEELKRKKFGKTNAKILVTIQGGWKQTKMDPFRTQNKRVFPFSQYRQRA